MSLSKHFIMTFLLIAAVVSAQGRAPSQRVDNGYFTSSGTFGERMFALDDVDGDGSTDYAVTAPNGPNIAGPGEVHVFSGRTGALLKVFSGDQSNSHFGYGVADLGDANGDGVRDIVVGVPWYATAAGNRAGRVWAFDGATGGTLWATDSTEAFSNLGEFVFAIPDFTGDGIRDVAAAEPSFEIDNRGRIAFLNGATGALVGYAEGLFPSNAMGVEMTARGATIYAGDGVGRVYAVTPSVGMTSASLLFDPVPGAPEVELAVIMSPTGALELLIGRRFDDRGGFVNGGSVELWSVGAIVSAGGVPTTTIFGTSLADSLGAEVIAGRDIDGDGVEEIVYSASAPGLASTTVRVATRAGVVVQDQVVIGSTPWLASIPDVTGDGRGEWLQADINGVAGFSECDMWCQGLTTSSFNSDPVTGITATFDIDLSAAQGGAGWVAAYSLSGTAPGFVPTPGGPLVPLNIDATTIAIWGSAGSPGAPPVFGTLTGAGTGTFSASIPASAMVPPLLGQKIVVAVGAVVGGALTGVTNPVVITVL